MTMNQSKNECNNKLSAAVEAAAAAIMQIEIGKESL